MSAVPRRLQAREGSSGWALQEGELVEVVEALKGGGLVVYPTDTLYGLGADPYDGAAMDRLYRVKGRPPGEPVALVVASLEEARRLAHLSPAALRLWEAFLPGPVTLILRATPEAPPRAVTGEGGVGLRMPDHGIPLAVAREFGPFTATSANRHGRPSPRTREEAEAQLGDEVDLYVDAGPSPIGRGSTVVDLTGERATVKREGAVARDELERHG